MKYKLEAACGCNIGRVRGNNEDNFYFNKRVLPQENGGLGNTLYLKSHTIKDTDIFGVFDGMGGEENGQVASFLAADSFRDYCDNKKNYSLPYDVFMKHVVMRMNDAVCEESAKGGGSMGTTAAILRFDGEEAYVCNVGDSRIFCLRGDKLFQISKDHTDEKFLRMQGITNRKPRLTQNIGVSPEEMVIEPHIQRYRLDKGIQFLICSDGLTDMVSQEDIFAMMSEGLSTAALVEKLIATALANGGKDNTTVIAVKIQ